MGTILNLSYSLIFLWDGRGRWVVVMEVLGGLQHFSVSLSPLGTNWVLELIGTLELRVWDVFVSYEL